jgi:hypothetical protein
MPKQASAVPETEFESRETRTEQAMSEIRMFKREVELPFQF